MAYTVQSNFNRGELAPEMERRDDLDHYFAGLRTATNVTSIPQGGLKRRPGTRYVADIGAKARLIPFEFNVDQTYVIALCEGYLHIYSTATADDTHGTVESLQCPYTEEEIFDASNPVRWTQQADTLILVHQAHVPLKLMRNVGATPEWKLYRLMDAEQVDQNYQPDDDVDGNLDLADELLVNVPLFDFHDDLSPTGEDVQDEVQRLQFGGTWVEGNTFKLTLPSAGWYINVDDQLNKTPAGTSPKIVYSTNTDTMAENIRAALVEIPALAELGDDCIEVALEQGGDELGPFAISFVNAAGNKNWPLLEVKYGNVETGGSISMSETTEGGGTSEPVWSTVRGWPRTATFHEERLVFGGTPHLPASVWMSQTNYPFDFYVGTAMDDEAIDARMSSDRLDAVVSVISLRNFVTLTSGAEFYSPDIPITPRNVAFRRDTARGSASVRPVVLDGSIIFVQRDRSALRQMLFSDVENAYVVDDLTILSRHMLVGPQDMDVLQGTLGDFVHVVNEDGTIVVLNLNRAQGVNAWTRYETRTGDKFISIAVVSGEFQVQQAWVCVERSIAGTTTYFLERFDESAYLDCSLVVDATVTDGVSSWSGLEHLEGETVMVAADSRYYLESAVTDGIVSMEASATTAEIGFNTALPVVETLPVAERGSNAGYRKSRILRATLDLLQSRDVWCGMTFASVQCTDPPNYEAEDAVLDDEHFPTPSLITGQREVRMLGWYERPTLKITQTLPVPFYVRGIELEVLVNG